MPCGATATSLRHTIFGDSFSPSIVGSSRVDVSIRRRSVDLRPLATSRANMTPAVAGLGLLSGDPSFSLCLCELERLCNSGELIESRLQVLHDLLGDDLGRLQVVAVVEIGVA